MNTKKRLNVLFACNAAYAMPMTVCLTSLLAHHSHRDVHVFVLHSPLAKGQEQAVMQVAETFNQTAHLLPVSDSYFKDAPVFRWSRETYYRLLIDEILPADLDRILYLDCDTVAVGQLDDLYDQDLQGYYAAARAEEDAHGARHRLGMGESSTYFQAGVILFDLISSRRKLTYQSALEIIESLGERLEVVDQDVLNVLFEGKIKEIEGIYNDTRSTDFNGSAIRRLLNHFDLREVPQTRILHYATGKPWNRTYSGSLENVWNKYLLLSPYAQMYAEKYGTISYKILRTGVCKTLFYLYIRMTPYINRIALALFSPAQYDKLKKIYRTHIK